jgi:signal transduction histidine kinase
VALGNVALFRRAQAVAAAETRQAIARDLHDSVSQTLFSVTLQARAAQAALRKAGIGQDHPAARALAEVSGLNHGALAEMRALIFELRPGALAEEGLVAALTKQATAITARLQIQVSIDGPPTRLDLPPHVEEHLYRLTMEAVNNSLKHACASTVTITVSEAATQVRIDVVDDGAGFDPSLSHPGHLGLGTMRERAASIGASLELDSRPGDGTRVTVRLPLTG